MQRPAGQHAIGSAAPEQAPGAGYSGGGSAAGDRCTLQLLCTAREPASGGRGWLSYPARKGNPWQACTRRLPARPGARARRRRRSGRLRIRTSPLDHAKY